MKHEEDNLQVACMDYLRYQYPKVLSCHIANERDLSRNIKTDMRTGRSYVPKGVRLKRKGVLSGMPDILIFKPRQNKLIGEMCDSIDCGLAVELKSKKGILNINQKECLSKLHNASWKTCVIRDFDTFKEIVDEYLKKT